ncbi:hypothetical protein PHYC_00303 [Phycisphaerales bacterium]|nr:hypothetical protein PHYC_00303 [Phycisphaerales bacterium]
MPRYSWKFWVLVPVALACIVFAAWLVIWGVSIKSAFLHERETPLATFECDLSRPGTHDIPVTVRYPAGHGFKFIVAGPARSVQAWEQEPWLAGLSGEAHIAQGPWGASEPTALLEWLSFASGPDSRAIVRVPGSSPGQYVLRLDVTSGARGLAGVPHTLIIYNDVCGCETMAAFFGWVIAAGAGVVGLVLGTWGVSSRRPKPAVIA